MIPSFLYYGTAMLVFFLITKHNKPPKKQAWLLTLVNSFVTAMSSIIFYSYYIIRDPIEWFTSSKLGDEIVIFLATFFILDLFVGLIFYRKEIKLLSGLIHHLVYFYLSLYILTKEMTNGFSMSLIMEFPTLILSLGQVYPRLRNDLLYGILFFIFRILFHTFVIYKTRELISYPVNCLLYLAYILHIYWFSKWYHYYGKFFIFPATRKANSSD